MTGVKLIMAFVSARRTDRAGRQIDRIRLMSDGDLKMGARPEEEIQPVWPPRLRHKNEHAQHGHHR